mmetsp:Transcript_16395/g.47127  ORF Transcript_16395/g.47127 Transcript_16395/m.47127 type:complete len:192 (-) Transcript_16395:291-866(-)|eukprot:CAMPEP_0113589184 /NCGR_PEP_ID=MMETSP0015_2-20120614/35939_1 /TAXON_ID=2838 /ORGANISM="Odontella" /LENGTH=191 /DNA_ID=CAMNT_0000495159 /DNA_START=46 /DNA_END=621 /DNA_ORIENTATION=- /assembly_acc=CAM_ASM_000160
MPGKRKATEAAIGGGDDSATTSTAFETEDLLSADDTPCISAEDITDAGADAIVASAGNDKSQLSDLISLADELRTAATARLKEVKRSSNVCECGEKAKEHCSGCDDAVCLECKLECVCGTALCDDCHRTCDFDDGVGGQGCGEPVCNECYVTTKCGKEVGGCEDCMIEYDCPDCDICQREDGEESEDGGDY